MKMFLHILNLILHRKLILKPKEIKRITDTDCSVPGSYIPLSLLETVQWRILEPVLNI